MLKGIDPLLGPEMLHTLQAMGHGDEICIADAPGTSVLIVYPWTGRPGIANPPNWDDIPGAHGSTPELEGFRDLDAEFRRLGVRLFAFSRQATD